ncbi:uncharacterized protein PAC_19897 [Phialocephala subalpina]|uniref:Carboxylic ester hydrolase n=1 Tax=Phialocephala subalpina TaxID=576137 RepID=A0A1L7XYF7_9HELO|nr:uncharacterized protein PAC_19897 [Phialocephala subalpina]
MPHALVTVDTVKPEFYEELYLVGKIPLTQCIVANQFSYCLYIPRRYQSLRALVFIVIVHGSGRDSCNLRDSFVDLAERQGCAILCPLFPRLPQDPYDLSNYKTISYQNSRYDLILLAMINEVTIRYPRIQCEKFLLYGFSGGGQFVHRFAYLHPGNLCGLAIGAPGTITLPDPQLEFPSGIKDIEEVFGVVLDWEALKKVPTMFIAGQEDTDDFHAIARGRAPPLSLGEGGRYGGTVRLEKAWSAFGSTSHFVAVSKAAHDESRLIPFVKEFFEQVLSHRHGDQAAL